jgi:succinoglycan biosynthesis protein ExoM
MVESALRAIDAQEAPDGTSFNIVIADNDETQAARARIELAMANSKHAFTYVHAPFRNISIARNACLDHADGDWVAFQDDDQYAPPTWLKEIYQTAIDGQFDVVFAPVHAVYDETAPKWMRSANIHSTPPLRPETKITTGASGNCLINVHAPMIAGQRFRLDKGRTGGEDTEFFFRLSGAGAKLGATEKAAVREVLSPDRLSLKWLMRNKLRYGLTYGRHISPTHGVLKKFVTFVLSIAKFSYYLLKALLTCWSERARNVSVLRGMFHWGVALSIINVPEQEIY